MRRIRALEQSQKIQMASKKTLRQTTVDSILMGLYLFSVPAKGGYRQLACEEGDGNCDPIHFYLLKT